MDLDWFRDLGFLARTGNFSQAAELNHISQSAFSRRIRALEAWVGATLVDRSRHPVKLTEAGRQILEAGEQAVNRVETERDQIRESLEQPDRYVVTFGAQHSIGWRFFPAWLQAFEKAFGPIISRLRADNLPNCIVDLDRGEVDFVISYESEHARGVDHSPETASLLIGTDQLIPVCKPGPDGIALFRVDDDDLPSIPYLRFGPSAPIGKHIDPLLSSRRLGLRLRSIYENSMAGALRIRARDGLGVAWLPRTLVEADMDSGLLMLAGSADWWIDVEIRLHRLKHNRNRLILRIWKFLECREGAPLA
jgi:DNA-binding transcriptional LysR family regulator